MKIVFHPIFKKVYSHDPAAKPGRIEAILKEIEDDYDFVMPQPARERDLRIVHTRRHIDSVKENPLLFEVACFSAGGAIMAAEFAVEGEPSFGLIRPPGHHASPDSCWGFCFFNNIAVAIEKLIGEGKVLKASIVDFDLHMETELKTYSGIRATSPISICQKVKESSSLKASMNSLKWIKTTIF